MSGRDLIAQRGSAFVELTVALPLLLLVFVGVVDLARVFYTSIELSNAARAGAQYGSTSYVYTSPLSTIKSKAEGASNISGITATPTLICKCATADGATFSDTAGGINNCTAAPAVSCTSSSTHRVMFMEVVADKTFSTVMNYPGMPNSFALTRKSTMRVSE